MLWADCRRALARLYRELGFTLFVTVTLAAGVGSTAAVFGMVNRLLLQPVTGIADPDRVAFLALDADNPARGLSLGDFDELRSATTVQAMASYGFGTYQVGLGDGRVVDVPAMTVYGDFFEALGAPVIEGRVLRGEETRLGSDPRVAVVSADLSRRLFGSTAQVAGRTIVVNGESVTVLGVTGEGFKGPEKRLDVDMWLPHTALVPLDGFTPSVLTSPRSTMHSDIVLRLAEGASEEAARAEITRILGRVAAADPTRASYFDRMAPVLHTGLRVPPSEQARTLASLAVFGVFAGLVLLIACANAATLLLARTVSRQGEIATSRALGASSAMVARYSLIESLLLAGCGSVAGLVFGWALTWPFRAERLPLAPVFGEFVLDWRLAAFAIASVVATTVLAGVSPAVLAARLDVGRTLRESTGSRPPWLVRIQGVVSVTQTALSLALLVCGLLMARTVRNIYSVETGFSTDNIWTIGLGSPSEMGPSMTPEYSRVGG